jgi:muramidase (phage lysozyme)
MARGPSRALLLTAAAAAVLLLARRAQAAPLPYPYSDNPLPGFGDDDTMPAPNVDLPAFLYMIRRAEHFAGDVATGADYFTMYGGGRFRGTADHPVITGETRGVPLSDAMCRAAGFGPGCVSTAAGAFQIIAPSWRRVREAGAWGPRLPDFSPASQDEAARRLLIEAGVLPLIEAGQITEAIYRAGRVWASLPGSTAQQRPKSLDTAVALFNDGLELYRA